MAEQTKQLTPAQQANPAKKLTPTQRFNDVVTGVDTQKLLKQSLGSNVGTFTTSLVELFASEKQLQNCDHGKIVLEAVRAAALHLPLSKQLGYAYITVFNVWDNDAHKYVPTPTFMIGYKGLVQLAMRTGQYRLINADICFEGMLQKHNRLTGEIDLSGEPTSDKIVGYFAHFELINGFKKTLYMSLEEMARYALRYSPSFKRSTDKKPLPTVDQLIKEAQEQYENGVSGKQGWEGNFNAMAFKTVLRRLLSKYGVLSIEMQNAIIGEAKAIENADAVEIRNNINAEEKPTFDASQYVEAEEVPQEETSNPFK